MQPVGKREAMRPFCACTPRTQACSRDGVGHTWRGPAVCRQNSQGAERPLCWVRVASRASIQKTKHQQEGLKQGMEKRWWREQK